MASVITLDACVLIAHFSQRDAHHDAAVDLLRTTVGDEKTIHPVNLTEVLVGGARIGRGRQMYDDVRALGVQVASPGPTGWFAASASPDPLGTLTPLAMAELRAASGLKLPDCYALATAQYYGGALATFDERLADAARTRGLTVLGR